MINWTKAHNDKHLNDIAKHKQNIYDTIHGELNRISVSDDYEEKRTLFTALQQNIIHYYNACTAYTQILLKYDE